jgi:hypothetical protein
LPAVAHIAAHVSEARIRREVAVVHPAHAAVNGQCRHLSGAVFF